MSVQASVHFQRETTERITVNSLADGRPFVAFGFDATVFLSVDLAIDLRDKLSRWLKDSPLANARCPQSVVDAAVDQKQLADAAA